MILIIESDFVLNEALIEKGQYIRTTKPEQYIQKGYARNLTKEETRAILDEYVSYAETVFNKKEATRTLQARYGQENLI